MATPPAKPYELVLLPGDGIGPEVMHEARLLLEVVAERTGIGLALTEIPCGGRYYLEHAGRDWPEGSEEVCARADLLLLGAVGWPRPDGKGPVSFPDGRMAGWSAVLGNRSRLDLYANVRPVRLLPGVAHRIHGELRPVWRADRVDFVVVRENTEGLYSGIGGRLGPPERSALAIDDRVVTRHASERVIRYAFELSQRRGRGAPRDHRKRVTCIAKNNVLAGCQLFVDVFREVGRDYPGVDQEVVLVDAFGLHAIAEPERFDVCVTTNLFGDIVTDLAAVLQGGMGMAVGCNIGDRHAMFEPIHGSAPTLPPGRANPLAMLLATGEALRWLGEKRDDARLGPVADAIEAAVRDLVAAGAPLPADLAGESRAASTGEVSAAVRSGVAKRLA